MEAGVKRVAVAMLALAVARASLLDAQASDSAAKLLEEFEKKYPPTQKNAAAEEFEGLALDLGIALESSDQDASRPVKEDEDAYRQAGFSTWLDAQVRGSDDGIGVPPPRMNQYLETHQAALARMVGLLTREVPDWGYDVRQPPRGSTNLWLIQVVNKVLLSAALVEEGFGHRSEARSFVNASWSLYRSVSSEPNLMYQLVAIALGKVQVATVRKLCEPGFEWLDRMSGDEPWLMWLETLESGALFPYSSAGSDPDLEARTAGWRALVEALRERSPCEVSKLSIEEISKPALSTWRETELGNVVGGPPIQAQVEGLRRAARFAVDRELAARVLELRQEKAASRKGEWPDTFFDLESRTCPEARYVYETSRGAMRIRFDGTVGDPEAPALVLPLSFETKPAKPPARPKTPTGNPRPLTRPTPRRTLPAS